MIKYKDIPHYIDCVLLIFTSKYWSLLNRSLASYRGVIIGPLCLFRGCCIFRRLPNTSIEFGNSCSFNSSHSSNLIGVYSPCMFSTLNRNAEIKIGNSCGFSGTVIAAAKSIKLGDNVRCGANTMITDTDWHTDDLRTGKDAAVIIGDNVWLGYGVKVLKGVSIGENSLIGAGSIVTRDIPANVVAAGNPCKVIKNLFK